MASLQAHCPACWATFPITQEQLGQPVSCPRCGNVFIPPFNPANDEGIGSPAWVAATEARRAAEEATRLPLWVPLTCLPALLVLGAVAGAVFGRTGPFGNLRTFAAYLTAVILLAIPLLLVALRKPAALRHLGLNRGTMSLRHIAPVALACVCWPVFCNQLSHTILVFSQGGELSQREIDALTALLAVRGLAGWGEALLCVVLVPALCEEFFFRGLLLRALRQRTSAGPAVFIAAALFTIVHFQWLESPSILTLGVVLGLLAVFTGSIWCSVFLHAAVNLLALVAFNLLSPAGKPRTGLPGGDLLMLGALVGGVLSLWWLAALRPRLAAPPETVAHRGPTCPSCQRALAEDVLVCVGCGFDRRLGRRRETVMDD
jgi:predicted Zn finger-like uncharacterized protein